MSVPNLVLQIPLSEYLSMYLISIMFVTVIGIIIVEWFDRRFEKLITPLCKRVSDRRETVIARETAGKKKPIQR
jgi:hypothetical protein